MVLKVDVEQGQQLYLEDLVIAQFPSGGLQVVVGEVEAVDDFKEAVPFHNFGDCRDVVRLFPEKPYVGHADDVHVHQDAHSLAQLPHRNPDEFLVDIYMVYVGLLSKQIKGHLAEYLQEVVHRVAALVQPLGPDTVVWHVLGGKVATAPRPGLPLLPRLLL